MIKEDFLVKIDFLIFSKKFHNIYRKVHCSGFVCKVVCLDLEGEWPEDSAVTVHPDLAIPDLQFVEGGVGEGGDHVNVTFKNIGDTEIVVKSNETIAIVKETASEEVKPSNENGNRENNEEENVKESVEEKENSNEKKTSEPMEEEDGQNDKSEEKPGEQTSQESSGENAFDKLFKEKSDENNFDNTVGKEDKEKTSSESAHEEPKNSCEEDSSKDVSDSNGTTDKSPENPTKLMRFVNEADEEMETESQGESAENGEDMENSNDQEDDDKKYDKPTLKLASFSTMEQSTENGTNTEENESKEEEEKQVAMACEAREDACALVGCHKGLENIKQALVWETMMFCDEECLGRQQAGMSNCATCSKEVMPASLGKYCVRY